jgi:hypothetical protein
MMAVVHSGYDWFDNLGKPSADRIIPELQAISVGDWVPMSGKVPDGIVRSGGSLKYVFGLDLGRAAVTVAATR